MSLRSSRYTLGLACLIVTICTILMGCNRAAPRGSGPLQLPAEGYINLLSRSIMQSPDKIHWKWSILGERNWRKAEAQGAVLSLSDVYALNNVTERGGCNVWELDLEVTAPNGQPAVWEARLHGSVGTTVVGKGTLDLQGSSLISAVRIVETGDTSLHLPADIIVARLGGTDLRLTIAK